MIGRTVPVWNTMWGLGATALAATLVISCQSEPRQAAPPTPSVADSDVHAPAVDEKEEVTYIFDAAGALLPSDDFTAGVRLPVGLELFLEKPGVHIYRIRAPINKVLKYFGPILITGSVDQQGRGAVYRRASVRGAEISPTKVDVSILDIGGGYTRVSITELPPPPKYPPSQDEVLKAARRDFERLD